MNKGRVGGKGARPPRVRSRARVTFPRSAHAQCANGGEARAARAGALGAPGVRGRGGGGGGDGGATGDSDERRPSVTAMYRHVTATVSAAVRLRPGRAWAPAAAAAPGSLPPRRRYRARPQDLEPPVALPLLPPPPCPQVSPGSVPRGLQGLGGPVTTVDGRREDDIDVRDPPRLLLGPPGPPPGTPGTPPGRGHNPPSMEEHLASMHEKLRHEGQAHVLAGRGSVQGPGLGLLCQPEAGGAGADAAPRGLERAGALAPHRAAAAPAAAALVPPRQTHAAQVLRRPLHLLPQLAGAHPLPPRGQADASPHGRPRAQEAAGGLGAGRGAGPALRPPPESPLSPPLVPSPAAVSPPL
ncbi:uncharacterized protein FYW23_015807 isoform 2-T2 [Sylvia borin]